MLGGSTFAIASGGPSSSASDYLSLATASGGPSENSANKETPRVATAVSASVIIANSGTLQNSLLSGSFVNSDDEPIPGTLAWSAFYGSPRNNDVYSWIFIPDNTSKYNNVSEMIQITVISEADAFSNMTALINSTTFAPLSEADKTSVANINVAIKQAIQTVANTVSPMIKVDVYYQFADRNYVADIKVNGSQCTMTVTDKFFNNQDTSLTILPDQEQYVSAISGSAITVVSGTSITQLRSALVAQNEYVIHLPQNQYPGQSDTVTSDMYIEVIARNNVDKKTYSIIIQ
jgi:hypothetical protein